MLALFFLLVAQSEEPGSTPRDLLTRTECPNNTLVSLDPNKLRAGDKILAVDEWLITKDQPLDEVLLLHCPGQEVRVTIEGRDGVREERMTLVGRLIFAPAIEKRPSSAIVIPPKGLTKPKPEWHWYGWQTGLSDLASTVLFFGSAEAQSGFVFVVSLLGYAIVPPIIHGAHGNGVRAAISLGMRVVAPLAIGFITAQAADDGLTGVAIGLFTMPVAMLIDDAAVAWEPHEE